MKRIATAFMLLAGLGGCMNTDRTKAPTPYGAVVQSRGASPYQGPYGEPIGPGNLPRTGMSPGMMPVGYIGGNSPRPGTNLVQAGYMNDGSVKQASGFQQQPDYPPRMHHNGGIVPVPAMGPPGAVAATGALPYPGPQQPSNMRTSVNFASPDGMRVSWYVASGWSDTPLVTPARYNFLQGGVYRMKLSSVANRVEKVYYPTLEVVPAHEKTATYLAHSSVPITFTDEDFEQVDSGNFLVKVVYLPDPHNQDLATVVGPNELVSTRLEPGVDPIVEATKRGTILLIVRMGNIDLNAPNSPAMDAPNPYMMQRGPPPSAIVPDDRGNLPLLTPVPGQLPPPMQGTAPAPKPKIEENKKPTMLPTLP